MALQLTQPQMELWASLLLFTVTQMITNHSLLEILAHVLPAV
jgi:hypothetical protein